MERAKSILTADELKQQMADALAGNDTAKFYEALEAVAMQKAEAIFDELKRDDETSTDSAILVTRGVRQLTSAEKKYYNNLIRAMKSAAPKQELGNLNLVMPETVIDAVFEDLRTRHPLLSAINFRQTRGAIKMLVNTNETELATWGKLCDEIVKELSSGFKEIDTGLKKLSAFIPVCKAMLELGPEWLDRYVREILYEALANGLEYGIINGTGNDMPIGMARQVGDDVTVTGGVYPEKPAVPIFDLTKETIGELLSQLATSPAGKYRVPTDIIFVVNPFDYFAKVFPATTVLAPDGTYRNNVLPYPMRVISSNAVPVGRAIIGLANKYDAFAGMGIDGRIEYSDEYHFLEDERVYLIKLYANGQARDNNAFIYLNISGLKSTGINVTVSGTVNTVAVPAFTTFATAGTTERYGKTVSELQSDVTTYGGVIKGKLNYVEGYTGYSGDTTKQNGHFLALDIDADDDAVIEAELLGGYSGVVQLGEDDFIVARIESKFQQMRITVRVDGASNTTIYSLAGLTLADAAEGEEE